MVELEILECWGKETELRKKWMKNWEKLGARILKFPKWMQTVILQDVNCAVQNRISTMEMILVSMEKHETEKQNRKVRS